MGDPALTISRGVFGRELERELLRLPQPPSVGWYLSQWHAGLQVVYDVWRGFDHEGWLLIGAGEDEDGRRVMTVEAAVARGGRGWPGCLSDVSDAVADLARYNRCQAIQFSTRRPGFDRAAPVAGWRVVEKLWERPVDG